MEVSTTHLLLAGAVPALAAAAAYAMMKPQQAQFCRPVEV
jgi:hypothetical protein